MGYRIRPQEQFTVSKKTAPVKRKDYLSWLHELPCLCSGPMCEGPIEAAHISTGNRAWGHLGRAKGRKASDRWAVPMCRGHHAHQHSMGENAFWNHVWAEPYATALALYGLYSDLGDEATDIAADLILKQALKMDGTVVER